MVKVHSSILVCVDCCQWLANADASSLDFHYDESEARERLAEIQGGERDIIETTGGHIVCGNIEDDEEFSRRACDCCGSRLHGSRHAFTILVDDK